MHTPQGAARAVAVSPDGTRLAFVAADRNGRTMLWVRPLDTAVAQPLRGTENAGSPFWSPDSRFLGFAADGRLKKIDLAGGPPQTIADQAAANQGGAWSRDGIIVFNAGGNAGLQQVSANGGAVSPVTALEEGEVRHQNPYFLPDGQHFLYGSFATVNSIHVGSLNSKEHKLLLRDIGLGAAYAQGVVLYTRGGAGDPAVRCRATGTDW